MKLTLVFAVCLSAFAADGPAFEVASIKPNHSNDGRIMIQSGGGTSFRTENTPLRMLITYAWNVRDSDVSGATGWIDSDRWDINAKPEKPVAKGLEGEEDMRAMVRALLIERFHLQVHSEKKETGGFALTVAKGGPKMKTPAAEAKGPQMRMGMGTLEASKVKMPMLARMLSNQLSRPVSDETGLDGEYDFQLEFQPEAGGMLGRMMPPPGAMPPGHEAPPDLADRPTLTTAVQEQLGLRLEPRKVMVDMLIIDKAVPASEN
jgi:uncharacterized protein (TIGR03435 family)